MLKRRQFRSICRALSRARFDLDFRLIGCASEAQRRHLEDALAEVRLAEHALLELPLDSEDWRRTETEAG